MPDISTNNEINEYIESKNNDLSENKIIIKNEGISENKITQTIEVKIHPMCINNDINSFEETTEEKKFIESEKHLLEDITKYEINNHINAKLEDINLKNVICDNGKDISREIEKHVPQYNRKPILCIGLVCLDVISVCKAFPSEDTDQRALSQRWQRGGNASNNCSVLRKLDHDVHFAGTVASGTIETCFMMKGFEEYSIDTRHIVSHDECASPLSVAIVNESNGSRTIMHLNKNLPEYTIEDFLKIDLFQYNWIHFETRYNVHTIVKMIQTITKFNENNPNDKITISLEIEKPRVEYELLFGLTDYTFISKDLARLRGATSMEHGIENLSSHCMQGSTLIIPWGDKGAIAYNDREGITSVSAFTSDNGVVDTLGAGDTFVAAFISTQYRPKPLSLKESLEFSCKIAGEKCGIHGFDKINCATDQI